MAFPVSTHSTVVCKYDDTLDLPFSTHFRSGATSKEKLGKYIDSK